MLLNIRSYPYFLAQHMWEKNKVLLFTRPTNVIFVPFSSSFFMKFSPTLFLSTQHFRLSRLGVREIFLVNLTVYGAIPSLSIIVSQEE